MFFSHYNISYHGHIILDMTMWSKPKYAQNTQNTPRILKIRPEYSKYAQNTQNTHRILKIRTEYSKYTQNTQNTHRILKIRTEYSKYTQNTQSTQRIPNKRSICSLQISKLALNKLHEGYSPKNSNLELCTIQYDLGRVFNASGFYLRATASPVNSLYKSLQFRAISWNSAQLRAIQEQLRAIPHSCAQRNSDWKP